MSPCHPLPIGIAVVQHAGRYLVGTRGATGPLPGLAEFPGGKCREGEAPRDCAARECLEETGLQVCAEQLLIRREYAYPHAVVDLHFWLCRPADVEAVQNEHRGYRWISAEGLSELPFPPANAPVIEMLTPRNVG